MVNGNLVKVQKGMSELAKKEDKTVNLGNGALIKPKRWFELIEKPCFLNSNVLFDEEVGKIPGIVCWKVEDSASSQIDKDFTGKFYTGDCYIILKTCADEGNNLSWEIFYWIGSEATQNKKGVAAITAVNLKRFLRAECRTLREDQGEESNEFLELFGTNGICVEQNSAGFHSICEMVFDDKLSKTSTSRGSFKSLPAKLSVSPKSLSHPLKKVFPDDLSKTSTTSSEILESKSPKLSALSKSLNLSLRKVFDDNLLKTSKTSDGVVESKFPELFGSSESSRHSPKEKRMMEEEKEYPEAIHALERNMFVQHPDKVPVLKISVEKGGSFFGFIALFLSLLIYIFAAIFW